MGSPTNRPGSDKTRDQGSFGPSTGGPDLDKYLKKDDRLFLLRQGEPGTSQYIMTANVKTVTKAWHCVGRRLPPEDKSCDYNLDT